MLVNSGMQSWRNVAPLAGSVDRNIPICNSMLDLGPSLPSRGAWIEILLGQLILNVAKVAPLAGNVDRNHDG